MICKECLQDKQIEYFKPYKKKNGEMSHRKLCIKCYNKRNNSYPSVYRSWKNRSKKRGSRIGVEYLQLNTDDLIFIEKSAKCNYWLNKEGVIYVQYKCGFREVEKRIGSRGYIEFKIGRKSVNYKRTVAEKLVPNNCNGNFVFSKDGDIFNTHPDNLRWVWTRNNQYYSFDQALSKATDSKLIEAYKSGDKRQIIRLLNSHFEKIYTKCDPNLIGDLYLKLTEYAERNLLFNIKQDSQQTYFGLKKQQNRRKLKTIQLNEKYT